MKFLEYKEIKQIENEKLFHSIYLIEENKEIKKLYESDIEEIKQIVKKFNMDYKNNGAFINSIKDISKFDNNNYLYENVVDNLGYENNNNKLIISTSDFGVYIGFCCEKKIENLNQSDLINFKKILEEFILGLEDVNKFHIKMKNFKLNNKVEEFLINSEKKENIRHAVKI